MAEKKNLNLRAFLAENAIKNEEIDFVVSKRFVEDGEPVAWKIKPLTSEENEKILNSCRSKRNNPLTKEVTFSVDQTKYGSQLIVACVTYPDLNDAGLQDSYGAIGAEELVKKMLNPGEYVDLLAAVQEANGFEVGMDEKIKKAKN